jgi:hypothetical protein
MLYLLCWVSAQRAACRGYGTIPTAGRVALAFGEALLAVREGLVPVVGDGPGEGVGDGRAPCGLDAGRGLVALEAGRLTAPLSSR